MLEHCSVVQATIHHYSTPLPVAYGLVSPLFSPALMDHMCVDTTDDMSKLFPYSQYTTTLWPPTGPSSMYTWAGRLRNGLMQALDVSSGPFGQVILGAWVLGGLSLGTTHLFPQVRGTVGKPRVSFFCEQKSLLAELG